MHAGQAPVAASRPRTLSLARECLLLEAAAGADRGLGTRWAEGANVDVAAANRLCRARLTVIPCRSGVDRQHSLDDKQCQAADAWPFLLAVLTGRQHSVSLKLRHPLLLMLTVAGRQSEDATTSTHFDTRVPRLRLRHLLEVCA